MSDILALLMLLGFGWGMVGIFSPVRARLPNRTYAFALLTSFFPIIGFAMALGINTGEAAPMKAEPVGGAFIIGLWLITFGAITFLRRRVESARATASGGAAHDEGFKQPLVEESQRQAAAWVKEHKAPPPPPISAAPKEHALPLDAAQVRKDLAAKARDLKRGLLPHPDYLDWLNALAARIVAEMDETDEMEMIGAYTAKEARQAMRGLDRMENDVLDAIADADDLIEESPAPKPKPQRQAGKPKARSGTFARFAYVDGDGVVSERRLSNWRIAGQYLEGFDLDRMDTRTFRTDRVDEWLEVKP